MASLAPLRQLASALRTSAAARPQLRLSRSSVGSAPPHLCLPPSRVLSTQGLKGRGRSERGKEEEKAHREYIKEVTRRTDGGGVPKFRLPPPPTPTTHSESWALASHISPDPEENVLSFRTRFYMESSMAFTNGLQPEYQTKVVMMVKIHKLGLSAEEVQRILAVCPSNWYDKKTRLLKLQNNKFRSVQKNKMECRMMLDSLIDDARENAEAHAKTPDSELSVNIRSKEWRWLPHTPPTGS